MDPLVHVGPPAKKARLQTDYTYCIQCQKKKGKLVQRPAEASYERFLEFVQQRAAYGDPDYAEMEKRFADVDKNTLMVNSAKWHRACFDRTCHQKTLDRAKERFQIAVREKNSQLLRRSKGRPSKRKHDNNVEGSGPFRRSSSQPYDNSVCIFCMRADVPDETLFNLRTLNRGALLRAAVELSNNVALKVRLNSTVVDNDAHAIDVKYHKNCWRDNVDNVLNINHYHNTKTNKQDDNDRLAEIAADIEFFNLLEEVLTEKTILSMNDVHAAYINVRKCNGASSKEPRKDHLKGKIQAHMPFVEFSRPPRRNQPEQLLLKNTRELAIKQVVDEGSESEMRIIFQCARALRKAIAEVQPWNFDGSISNDAAQKAMPQSLFCFLKWLIQGPALSMTDTRENTLNQIVTTVGQDIMYAYKSNKQVTHCPVSEGTKFRNRREWPLQVATGIAIHQATRSKKLVDFLHGFGKSVTYTRVLQIENQLAAAVVSQSIEEGAFIPPAIVKSRFVFFAIDNSDFQEDTPDGKRTLHATATVIYQREEENDEIRRSTTPKEDKSWSKSNVVHSEILPCRVPASAKPKNPTYPEFRASDKLQMLDVFKEDEMVWLLSRSLIRTQAVTDDPSSPELETSDLTDQDQEPGTAFHEQDTPTESQQHGPLIESHHSESDQGSESNANSTPLALPQQDEPGDMLKEATKNGSCAEGKPPLQNIHRWSAYHSLKSKSRPLTRFGTLPLLAAPAHEWSTMLTVLKQAQHINALIVGPNRKTVVTLDMQLYEKAKKLQMYRSDCDHLILRIGEMHTIMTALRAAGASIGDSGLEDTWCEAGLYGPTTIHQILEGKHLKRALDAHLTTYQALFDLYMDVFMSENPESKDELLQLALDLRSACAKDDGDEVRRMHNVILVALENAALTRNMTDFDRKHSNSPLFSFAKQYMDMIATIFIFIRSSREGLWDLHLSSLDSLCKYFFAYDRLNYARMVPLYLADMRSIQTSDPDIWLEFEGGNFAVNKTSVPFCSIGPDQAIEHVNRWMKVLGGLSGITLNDNARNRFFLIAPELARLAEEAHAMAGMGKLTRNRHHELSPTLLSNQERNVLQLKATISSYTNPFTYDGGDLVNLVNQSVLPDEVAYAVSHADEIGQQHYAAFVIDRISSEEVNLWAHLKKVKLNTWTSARKAVRHRFDDKVVELKDDRSLFARLLIIARSRKEIKLREAVGKYEFSAVPRALFNPQAKLLPCTEKSTLMGIIEALPDANSETTATNDNVPASPRRVAIIDGMGLVKGMGQPDPLKTFADVANHFISKLNVTGFEEVHLVFDRYDLPQSLKTNTRERRQGRDASVPYHVTDTTNISKVPYKKLLSHSKTKDELTIYLAQKSLAYYQSHEVDFVVTSREAVYSNHLDVAHLESSHEEADTRMILHAVDASKRGATVIEIHSPDTDVFLLLIRRFPDLCKNTSFVTGKTSFHRTIPIAPIFSALGPQLAAALPGFHVFTGADQTGKFAHKGKTTCWKTLQNSPDSVVKAFADLGKTEVPSNTMIDALEMFVCKLYDPRTQSTSIAEVRWKIFSAKQLEATKLPPTRDALLQTISRAHYQSMIWWYDNVAKPDLPSPTLYGWKKEDEILVPVTTVLPAAPKAVIELVKCGCVKSKCAQNSCACRSNGLNCTELCGCFADEETCLNTGHDDEMSDSDEEE